MVSGSTCGADESTEWIAHSACYEEAADRRCVPRAIFNELEAAHDGLCSYRPVQLTYGIEATHDGPRACRSVQLALPLRKLRLQTDWSQARWILTVSIRSFSLLPRKPCLPMDWCRKYLGEGSLRQTCEVD